MARVNGTFDPDIAEMLDFYKAAAARSDAPVASSNADLSPSSAADRSVSYCPIPDRSAQSGREHR
jgi:hypothetical protein